MLVLQCGKAAKQSSRGRKLHMLSGRNTRVTAVYIHKLLFILNNFLLIVFKFTQLMYRYKNNISVFTIYYTRLVWYIHINIYLYSIL